MNDSKALFFKKIPGAFYLSESQVDKFTLGFWDEVAMIVFLLFAIFIAHQVAFAEDLKGDFTRVNGVRFFVVKNGGNDIFIPSDEFMSENERVSRSFCRNHLKSEDIIKLREGELRIRDENMGNLISQCKVQDAGSRIPEKRNDSIQTYDHRYAKSVKSVIDYLIKK